MVRVILHGACGRMGHVVAGMIDREENMTVVAGVDAVGSSYAAFPVYRSFGEVTEEADVVIDFSNAGAVGALLSACVERKLPLVLCTTGLSEAQTMAMTEASKSIAVLKSANMTVGVNLLFRVLKEVAPLLADAGFDIEIVEKHHNQKVDAPSGTAISLADAVNEALTEPYDYVYDRSARREKRPKKEIGISSVRGGTIVGDHDVIFAGEDEVITFSHRAYSRSVFAKGAVEAAKYLCGKKPGFYDMQDVIAGED